MNNLNKAQKEFIKTLNSKESQKATKKMFNKANEEVAGLTKDQIYCLNNTVYTDIARKKLIEIFRMENLMINLDPSIN